MFTGLRSLLAEASVMPHPAVRPQKEKIMASWRDELAIHPAADLFPLLSETDPAGFKAYVDRSEKSFQARLEEQKAAAK